MTGDIYETHIPNITLPRHPLVGQVCVIEFATEPIEPDSPRGECWCWRVLDLREGLIRLQGVDKEGAVSGAALWCPLCQIAALVEEG